LNTDAADNFVNSTAVQSDGKILIGGGFTNYNGVPRNGIARLNSDGSLDYTFNPGSGANVAINYLTIQPDGKILIGGYFTNYNGVSRRRVARLNVDGSLDTDFNPGTGANDVVTTLSLQSDGKILLGGKFNTFNGVSRNGIVRLNSDGSLDTDFNPATWTNSNVYSIVPQPDGKILISGYFTGTVLMRLNSDGSVDDSFTMGIGYDAKFSAAYAYSIALQPDGQIILGGNFIIYNGFYINRIVRLNSDGNIDFGFYFNSGNGVDSPFYSDTYVVSVVIQPDGKILIGGLFTRYNGVDRYFTARVNSDGSLDNTFAGSGANTIVYSFALQSDGKILVVGAFTYYNGANQNRIARLNSDGSIDTNFNPGSGVDEQVSTIALQPDGKILLSGVFTHYNDKFASENRNRIVRLNRDGSLDNSFNAGDGANSAVYSLALQLDGRILLGGSFTSINGVSRRGIARLNADGSLDNSFNPGSGTNNIVTSLSLQPDGQNITWWLFYKYQWDKSEWHSSPKFGWQFRH
jgi:uncharacterized delta-60 repeat protein